MDEIIYKKVQIMNNKIYEMRSKLFYSKSEKESIENANRLFKLKKEKENIINEGMKQYKWYIQS